MDIIEILHQLIVTSDYKASDLNKIIKDIENIQLCLCFQHNC